PSSSEHQVSVSLVISLTKVVVPLVKPFCIGGFVTTPWASIPSIVRCPRSSVCEPEELNPRRNCREQKEGASVAKCALGGVAREFIFWIVAVLFRVSREIHSPFTG